MWSAGVVGVKGEGGGEAVVCGVGLGDDFVVWESATAVYAAAGRKGGGEFDRCGEGVEGVRENEGGCNLG